LLDWWTRREVVAPLSSEVVRTEQGLTTAGVNLDQVRIEQKKVLTAYQQVKLPSRPKLCSASSRGKYRPRRACRSARARATPRRCS
jgi:hypothetical protein